MGWFGQKKHDSSQTKAGGGSEDYYLAAASHMMEQGGGASLPMAVAVLDAVPGPTMVQAVRSMSPPTVGGVYNSNKSSMMMNMMIPPAAPSLDAKPFLSRIPTVVPQCPHCHTINAATRVRIAPDLLTWILVAALVLVFWPLCWIPLVTDSTRRTTHYCVVCNHEVGQVGPLRDCCVKQRM